MGTGGQAEFDVVVIGAGVAGCAAAIALRHKALRVAMLERAAGPQSRFCGEFVSGEAVQSLATLGVDGRFAALHANAVRRLELHAGDGLCFSLPLASRGFGLTRRTLDAALLARAVELGVVLFPGLHVTAVSGSPQQGFCVEALADGDRPHSFAARAVIGAQGKRSSVDRALARRFLAVRSEWVGVRMHYRQADRGDAVALYLFPGGYCGAVSVEGGLTTLALLAGTAALKQCGDRPEKLIARARDHNPALREWLDRAVAVPGTLMAISQIPFAAKDLVAGGVFMAGDSAGVTAPFLGVGVASALGSALACAETVGRWLQSEVGFEQARRDYERWWRHRACLRSVSRLVSSLLCRPATGNAVVRLLNAAPWIAEAVYRRSRVQAMEAPGATSFRNKDCARVVRPTLVQSASESHRAGRPAPRRAGARN